MDLHLLLAVVLDKCEWPAFNSTSLPSGTELPVPFNRRLCGPQIWSGQFGGQIKLFPILGIKPRFLGLPARSLSTTPITLSWFLAENLDEDKNNYLYVIHIWEMVFILVELIAVTLYAPVWREVN